MKTYPEEIYAAYIVVKGDMSVGIRDNTVTIQGPDNKTAIADLIGIDPSDHKEIIESFRQDLKDTFERLYDEPVSVTFDFEEPN